MKLTRCFPTDLRVEVNGITLQMRSKAEGPRSQLVLTLDENDSAFAGPRQISHLLVAGHVKANDNNTGFTDGVWGMERGRSQRATFGKLHSKRIVVFVSHLSRMRQKLLMVTFGGL